MGVTRTEGIIPMERRLIGTDISRYKVVRKNWFAYNPMRLNIGSIARWGNDGDILVSPDYVVFRCLENSTSAIDPEFLDHFRRSNQWGGFVTKVGIGSVRVRIYYNDIASLLLKLPQLPEQRKIAACLTSLDELVAAHGQKLDALKAFKNGLMRQLFPREGEAFPRLRFPGFMSDWEENSLDGLSDSISSGRDKTDSSGAYDLYGSTGIIGKTSNGSYEGEYILVARVGANAGMLTRAFGRFGVTDNTLVISLNPASNLTFIFYYLEHLNLNRLIYGSGQPLITGGQLKILPILLPIESERNKIAICLSSLDELIASQCQKLDALKTHKKGLMQQLFPSPEEAL